MKRAPLISVDALAIKLDLDELRVFDCRFILGQPATGREQYRASHIAGAGYVDLEADLSGPVTTNSGRHPLPKEVQFRETLGRLGVSRESPVVVYDEGACQMAARFWWMLRWMGHDDVTVLDGGFSAWTRSGRAVEEGESKFPEVIYRATVNNRLWVPVNDVESGIGKKESVLVDARDSARFKGLEEPLDPVAGHIPGARNRPFMNNMSDGLFRPAEELRQEFEALMGGLAPQAVIHSCGSGVTACHNLLAMTYAGLEGSRLFVGSWSEWITDKRRAIAGDADVV